MVELIAELCCDGCERNGGPGSCAEGYLVPPFGRVYRSAAAIRKAAKALGWSRKDGYDYCPKCTANPKRQRSY